jgi:leucyl/phenylalanyl-tRNA--protein transferase
MASRLRRRFVARTVAIGLPQRHFPWFEDDQPILWWSPPQRMVLFLEEMVVSKSMRNIINRGTFSVTFNQDFRKVITHCRQIARDGQNGTWITNDMVEAYCKLHELGIAKSVEVWQENALVGGLYGIDLATYFAARACSLKCRMLQKWLLSHW